MHSLSAGSDFLAYMPNEILYNIMRNISDIMALNNIVLAHPSIASLYKATYKDTIQRTLSQIPSLQLQKLICAVISIRNGTSLPIIDAVNLGEYLDALLENEQISPMVDSVSNPLQALQAISTVSQDIDHFTKSFVASCLWGPGMQPCSNHTLKPLPTELHRIRRAFWRLQIIFALFNLCVHETLQIEKFDSPIYLYLERHLTAWELEEAECVYAYLRNYYRCTRTAGDNATLKIQLPILQRLLHNLGYNENEKAPPDLNSRYENISYFFEWAREASEGPAKLRTRWSDFPDTNHPNTGWKIYVRHRTEGGSLGDLGNDELSSGPEFFHSWGYCMWDSDRFASWGLLERRYGYIDTHKWTADRRKLVACRPCSHTGEGQGSR